MFYGGVAMKLKLYLYPLLAAALCIALAACLVLPAEETPTETWAPARPHVVIDAGHGGIDGGAVGYAGTLEKEVNLQIATKCELLLGLFGIDVAMTRREDTSLDDGTGATIARRKADDIKARVALANAGADALVSIHMNSFTDSRYWGTQTFYSGNHPRSVELAEFLQTAARTLLAPDNTREAKQAEKSIYLLQNVTIPAVIVECGFLSNPEEEAKLVTDEYQKGVAVAICAGTLQFLNQTA